jgi:CO/xanthine dehydrogenase Mo-binding subunit
METHAVIAQALPDDHIEVHTSAQSPYTVRNILCHSFDLPHANVRVHVPYIGGGFGGKAGIHLEPLAYCLSKAAGGRAVKLVATREEEFGTLPSRQGLHTEITIGVTSDGKIKAFKATYTWDAGAYADYGVNIGRAAAYSGAGPYSVPNCRIDSYVVYTNKVFGTAYRGFGHLEVMWGVERAIDITAHRLGMNPYEFRMKNLLKEGDKTITGETFTSGHGRPDKCLEAVTDAIGWGKKSVSSGVDKVRGKGIAALHKAPAMPTFTSCSAIIKLNEDASADILISGVDMGQGTYTVLRQIAAEELKLPIEKVHISWDCDTAFSPYDWQTVASRFTFMGGNAVIEAAHDCLLQIRKVAATVLKTSPERIVCQDGKAFIMGEESAIPYEKLVLGYTFENGNSIGGPVIGHGHYIAKGLTNPDLETGQGLPALYWTYGAHAVEIEVDKETGEIEILNIVTAIDAGKVLNPKLCKGQVVGGVLQGLGSTLFEGFIFSEEGRLLNPSFTDHKIPTMKDIPLATKQIFIETAQPDGPYGARGIAEHPMISVPSVVGNALYDALGIDFTELPLTTERIYLAIEEGRKPR